MIESAGNQINQNSINRNSQRLKADAKDSGEARSTKNVDADSFESTRSAEANNRPDSEPIGSREEAFEIVQFTSDLLLNNSGSAEGAQANLNPDSVLELIA